MLQLGALHESVQYYNWLYGTENPLSERKSIAASGMGKLDASCMPMADMTDTPQLHVVCRGIPCATCME